MSSPAMFPRWTLNVLRTSKSNKFEEWKKIIKYNHNCKVIQTKFERLCALVQWFILWSEWILIPSIIVREYAAHINNKQEDKMKWWYTVSIY